MKTAVIINKLNSYLFSLRLSGKEKHIKTSIHEYQNLEGEKRYRLEVFLFTMENEEPKVEYYLPSTTYKTEGIAIRYKKQLHEKLALFYRGFDKVAVQQKIKNPSA